METRAHYVLIGAFVLCAVAMAFLFILWLGESREYDEYDIVFRERVSGLSNGAPVRFNGIQKGEVQELRISPDDPSVVIARIRVEDDTPVKQDTRAELESVGFTGLAVIQLVGGTKDAPALNDVTRGIPMIEADTSGLAAFLEGSGDILAATQRLLSPQNTQAVTDILADVATVTNAFAAQEAEIQKTIQNTATLTENLAGVSEELSNAVEGLEALLEDDAPETLAEARLALAEVRTLAADFRTVLEENRDPIAIFTEQGLSQMASTITEARSAFRSLDRVLREVDRDPRGYILGDSTPRYQGEE